jgi:hypothetical protein
VIMSTPCNGSGGAVACGMSSPEAIVAGFPARVNSGDYLTCRFLNMAISWARFLTFNFWKMW